ncbi:MAG TPA: hypothetical protein VF273_08805, partial [Pelobium sp.]
MTFEEFFLKKKIDLDSFQLGKPDVFAEFTAHYEQMSEKSFDHTKKYWFNNLRIAFPLSEEKESKLKEAFKAKPEEIKAGETIGKPTDKTEINQIKAPAFKPRFKAQPPTLENKKIKEEIDHSGVSPKPAAFKPRFKAGATKTADVQEKETANPTEESSKEEKPAVAKPAAFKPRFKAGATKTVDVQEEETANPTEVSSPKEKPAAAKPTGFKPRFK